MPNYVYRGTDCAHEFEVYQSFSDDPLTECTECGKPVRRVFQPTGLVFKGSGWYITDSRKSSDNGSAKSDTNAATPASPDSAAPSKKSTGSREPATTGTSS